MRVGWEGLGTENVGGKVGDGETVAMDVVGGKEDFWERRSWLVHFSL